MLNVVDSLTLCKRFHCTVIPAWKILGKNKLINVQKDVNLPYVQGVLSVKIGICLPVQMENHKDTLKAK